ncbi:MAG: DJ-1/PfpI family protein [Candidatus Micrarchaeota archaeon]|nr:DJ-1/PfpI family protein [Candidatus Micrarchaeota archaeon]
MRLAIFIPQKGFKDESLSLVKLILDKWGVGYNIAAYGKGGIGIHGALVRADIRPEEIITSRFDGIVFIDGTGIDEQKLYDYRPLLDIVTHFNEANKYIVAIGNAAKIPIRANIVKAKKVAVGDEETLRLARLFNAIPTQSNVEGMGNLVTIKNSKAAEDSVEEWMQRIGLM